MEYVSNSIEDDQAPVRAVEKAMRLETDTFCEYCNYNLFGQEVTRDERIQILVARCPECGRFHPAGRGVSSSRVWLNRFGTSILASWVLFCVGFVAVASLLIGAMEFAYLEDFTSYIEMTPDGRRVQWDYQNGTSHMVIVGTTQIATSVVYKRVVMDRYHRYQYNGNYGANMEEPPLWLELLPFVLTSGIASVCLGLLFSVAFWHWKRRGYLSLVLPVLIGGIVFTIWQRERGVKEILAWSAGQIALWTLFDIVMLAGGVLFGRKIARLIVSLVIPPKPRQHFAFLWAADGKKWPFPQAAGAAKS